MHQNACGNCSWCVLALACTAACDHADSMSQALAKLGMCHKPGGVGDSQHSVSFWLVQCVLNACATKATAWSSYLLVPKKMLGFLMTALQSDAGASFTCRFMLGQLHHCLRDSSDNVSAIALRLTLGP